MRRFTFPASLAVFSLLACAIPCQTAAATPEGRTYNWIAELVATDATAKTITVKARIPGYISKYISRFKPGDRVMLVWNMLPPRPDATPAKPATAGAPPETTDKAASGDAKPSSSSGAAQVPATPPPIVLKSESDLLLSIDSYESMKGSKIDTGYILPAEFVAADAGAVTVKLRVADNILRTIASIPPGKWLRATSPMSQPTDVAALSAVTEHNPAAGKATK